MTTVAAFLKALGRSVRRFLASIPIQDPYGTARRREARKKLPKRVKPPRFVTTYRNQCCRRQAKSIPPPVE